MAYTLDLVNDVRFSLKCPCENGLIHAVEKGTKIRFLFRCVCERGKYRKEAFPVWKYPTPGYELMTYDLKYDRSFRPVFPAENLLSNMDIGLEAKELAKQDERLIKMPITLDREPGDEDVLF